MGNKKLKQRLKKLEEKQALQEWIIDKKERYKFIQDICILGDEIVIYFRKRGLFGRYYDHTNTWECSHFTVSINDLNLASIYLSGVSRYA